jgi:hypothetical protein
MLLNQSFRNHLFYAKTRESGKTYSLPLMFSLKHQLMTEYKAPKTEKEIDAEWGPPNEPNI